MTETNRIEEPFLRLAREFESAAETYRAVNLHGLARHADERRCAIETMAANVNRPIARNAA